MSRRALGARIALVCALWLPACAGSSEPRPNATGTRWFPPWMQRGTGYQGDAGAGFYGVYSQGGLSDRTRAKALSEQRARKELVRLLAPFLEELIARAAPGVGPGRRAVILADLQSSAQFPLEEHARLVESWEDPADRSQVVLLFLDLEALVRALQEVAWLEPEIRDRLAPVATEALQAAQTRLEAAAEAQR